MALVLRNRGLDMEVADADASISYGDPSVPSTATIGLNGLVGGSNNHQCEQFVSKFHDPFPYWVRFEAGVSSFQARLVH